MTLQSGHEAASAAADQRNGEDPAAQFLRGELGKLLGLSSEELRIGLTVARNHLSRGAPAEAMKIYGALVLCDPLNVDYQVGLANCASVMGEHHLALQAASAVIALAPSDPRGYLLSGRSCLLMGSFDEALEDLTDAGRLAKESGDELVAREATLLLDRLSAVTSA